MYDGIVQDLIDEFGRLPGIGPKSAQRIAFHILQTESFDPTRLSELLADVKEKVRFCEVCGNVTESERCSICRDPRRSPTVICVVEEAKDVAAIERTREFRGLYHVLRRRDQPDRRRRAGRPPHPAAHDRLAGRHRRRGHHRHGPEPRGRSDRDLPQSAARPMGIRTTRLASGLPVGGDLEYADEVTLGRAFEGRRLVGG